jgi:hypothetical protein
MTALTHLTPMLRPGDWAVVQIPGPAGDVVEQMQKLSGGGARAAKWVHAIYCVAVVPQVMIVEATPEGAKRNPLHYSPAALWWSTGRIEKTDTARAVSVAKAESYATANGGRGVAYSFLDYLAIADHRWHIPFPGLQGYIASSGHLICSQLVDSAELAGGTHLFTDPPVWPGYVRPVDLANLIDAP